MITVIRSVGECANPECAVKATLYRLDVTGLPALVLCWECWRKAMILVLRADAPTSPSIVSNTPPEPANPGRKKR